LYPNLRDGQRPSLGWDVLQRADPTLVDPGVTAQMERLLDDVLVGQQEMVGAIDAVCAQASRIIGRLREGTTSAHAALLSVAVPSTAGGRAARRTLRREACAPRASGPDDTGVSPKRSDAQQDERR